MSWKRVITLIIAPFFVLVVFFALLSVDGGWSLGGTELLEKGVSILASLGLFLVVLSICVLIASTSLSAFGDGDENNLKESFWRYLAAEIISSAMGLIILGLIFKSIISIRTATESILVILSALGTAFIAIIAHGEIKSTSREVKDERVVFYLWGQCFLTALLSGLIIAFLY